MRLAGETRRLQSQLAAGLPHRTTGINDTMHLLRIADLTPDDVHAIWSLARSSTPSVGGRVAWSFEGNGIRTRTTFIQAFWDLGLSYIELPNLLKTDERVCDLAG